MLRACDTMGELGWGDNVEFGPGKHGVGHSYYVYLLDPDGHRCELLLPPIVYMDKEDKPHAWDVAGADSHRRRPGGGACRRVIHGSRIARHSSDVTVTRVRPAAARL